MAVAEIGDPRLQALFGADDPKHAGVQPMVRLPRTGLPPIAIAIGALFLALILFSVLNARRTSQAEPSVIPRDAGLGATSWEAPPLYIPPAATPVTAPAPVDQQRSAGQVAVVPSVVAAPRPAAPQIIYPPQPVPLAIPAPPAPPRASSGAPLIIDTGSGAAPGTPATGPASTLSPPGQITARMRASAFANRSTTVPQGYLIPAVLETGFNSSQPGFARALVSQDVRSFDGSRVLIPRGSRLIGDYRSDVAQNQRRAIIIWSRLIRPDGMTIALDSPATDTVGRGGVAASVNTHFFQRLGDALLQSTVTIGSAIAGRAVTGPVVVVPGNGALPTGQLVPSNTYVPTLTVPPGKSISVFVAHDLDFSAAGAVR